MRRLHWHTSPDPSERLRAVHALPAESSSCPALLDAARDPSLQVAKAALERLQTLGGASEAAVLRERLLGVDVGLVAAYARTLRLLRDEQTFAAACAGLTDPSQTRRQAAAIALRELADERGRSALLGALADPAASVRRTSLEALARLAPDPRTEQACARALADPDDAVRSAAVRTLANITANPDALLRPLTSDPSTSVRRQVARAGAKLADETLWILSGDEHADVRAELLRTLRRQPRARLTPQVIAALSDVSWHVRRRACRALAAAEDRRARAPLVRALLDAHPLVRAEALRALHQIFRAETTGLLLHELQASDTNSRRALIYAIARTGDAGAAPSLAAYERDPSADVRIAVAHSLAALAAPEAPPVLHRLLGDDDVAVRNAARVALDEMQARS